MRVCVCVCDYVSVHLQRSVRRCQMGRPFSVFVSLSLRLLPRLGFAVCYQYWFDCSSCSSSGLISPLCFFSLLQSLFVCLLRRGGSKKMSGVGSCNGSQCGRERRRDEGGREDASRRRLSAPFFPGHSSGGEEAGGGRRDPRRRRAGQSVSQSCRSAERHDDRSFYCISYNAVFCKNPISATFRGMVSVVEIL